MRLPDSRLPTAAWCALVALCLAPSGYAVDLRDVRNSHEGVLGKVSVAFPVLPNQYLDSGIDPAIAFDLNVSLGPHAQLFTDRVTGGTLETSLGLSIGYATFDDANSTTLYMPGLRYQIGYGHRFSNSWELVGSIFGGVGYSFVTRPDNSSRSLSTAPTAEWGGNLDMFWIGENYRFGFGIGHQARRSYPRNSESNGFLDQDYMTARFTLGRWF